MIQVHKNEHFIQLIEVDFHYNNFAKKLITEYMQKTG